MSCYIVSNNHISAIVNFDPKTTLDAAGMLNTPATPEALSFAGEILLRENVRAYIRRYHEDPDVAPFAINTTTASSALALLKLCDCFDYQCSTSDEYRHSKAAQMITRIREKAIPKLADYNKQPWRI